MPARILLAEQHLRRGVDANASIAAYLEAIGAKTRLSLTGCQLYSHLARFEPHVVYLPWVTPHVVEFLRRREPSVPIINAFQEQNVALHQPDSPMVQWAGDAAYIFAWGEAHKDKFEQLFKKTEIKLVGNPRFDPYLDTSIAEALYPSRVELADRYSLPLDKEWVLFALDFPLLFADRTRLDELMNRGDLSKDRLTVVRETYRILKKWMRKLVSEKVSSSVLIVRPHPGSNLEQIKSDFGGENSSVRYIRGGGIPPWIIAADRYMTRASTSVVEAWIADTPTALINKDKHISAGLDRNHLNETERSIDTYPEFRAYINNFVDENSRTLHHDFLSHHYRLDGRSARRTAQEIHQIASSQEGNTSYIGGHIKNMFEHLKFATKKLINESRINRWNPFERPNDEFLSQKQAQIKIDCVKKSIKK